MMIEWWHWAVLGVGLMVAELILPAMVLVWFGLGALLVATVHFLFPDLSLIAQILIWIVSFGRVRRFVVQGFQAASA